MAVSKLQNHFSLEEAVGRVAISIAGHPFDYVKILIQLGFEPLPETPVKTLFPFLGPRTRLAYPSVFSYLSYIRQTDGGFIGMFRGLRYKILFTLINGFVSVNVVELLKSEDEPAEEVRGAVSPADQELDLVTVGSSHFTAAKVKQLVEKLLRETLCKFISLSASYPLQLMVIRSCSQFVGRETVYDSFTGAVKDIFKNGGVLGFYSGFAPRLFGDVLILWTSHGIFFVVKGFLSGDNTVKGYVAASINFVVTSLMYPFQVVSTVMAVNGPSAASLDASLLSPEFLDWGQCWRQLSRLGQIKRGSSLLWRYKVEIPKRNYDYKLA